MVWGLVCVQRFALIIESYGADLFLSNSVTDKGTTFYVELPITSSIENPVSFENYLSRKKQCSSATITINRPTKLNALNKATIEELHEAFKACDADKEIRAIIITGSGEKAFVAGADISEFAGFTCIRRIRISKKRSGIIV